jgi:hypothetical protein
VDDLGPKIMVQLFREQRTVTGRGLRFHAEQSNDFRPGIQLLDELAAV